MIVHSYPGNFNFINPVVTVGTFDGVHIGHREVIRQLNIKALELKGESVLVTLWPHPRIALGKTDNNFFLLNSLDEKIRLLSGLRIDHLLVIPFDQSISSMSSDIFVIKVLVETLNVSHLIVGTNNHYGNNREGDYTKIKQLSAELGFTVSQPDIITVNQFKVSSTEIRNAINAGRMDRAAEMLGYSYPLTGKVITGDRLGSTIGFPTANLKSDEPYKLIPPDGVYAAIAETTNGQEYGGMLYIGNRPTLKKTDKTKNIEIHLFNFTGDLYGQNLTIKILEKVRGDIKFENITALKEQIEKDKHIILKLLNK